MRPSESGNYDICWACYEDNHCYHEEHISALEDLKKEINKRFT